jgi:uncharacterized protein YggT (Ycf19 family)
VKVPRFRIAWVMVAVAIAALDFAAIRALSGWGHRLLLGALPMANVLAVGILLGQQSPGSHPFLLGFEAFGAMALAFYVALVSFFPDSYEPIGSYLALLVEPMEKFIGRNRPFILIPIAYFVAIIMLGWPQVAFALIGGFLSRRFSKAEQPD